MRHLTVLKRLITINVFVFTPISLNRTVSRHALDSFLRIGRPHGSRPHQIRHRTLKQVLRIISEICSSIRSNGLLNLIINVFHNDSIHVTTLPVRRRFVEIMCISTSTITQLYVFLDHRAKRRRARLEASRVTIEYNHVVRVMIPEVSVPADLPTLSGMWLTLSPPDPLLRL
ncbi:hypothetical protein OK512_11055 [Streptococcus pneumoniae]|nr:hypothetical protein [Streptococcus pneumoniae]